MFMISFKKLAFELIKSIPNDIFSDTELELLDSSTKTYISNTNSISETLEKKEIERFIIELSWKSSKIEGNTYTLLDTEKLIARGIEAVGHTKEESTMSLNHKYAFEAIRQNEAVLVSYELHSLVPFKKIFIDQYIFAAENYAVQK